MIVDEYFTINTTFNGQSIDLAPQEFSFSMADTIYNLYNYGLFELNDTTGLLQEYFGTIEGAEFELGYGTKELINTSKYVLKKDELSDIKVPGFLSGSVNIQIVNAWYGKQKIKSKAYQSTIATIISKLVQNQGFSSIDIENTGNYDYWYQMMMTDAKFIQEILLPNVYSSSAESPFYAYITSDNIFHLKSLKSMFNTNIVATIEYKASTELNTNKLNLTTSIKKFNQSSDEHRALLKRDIYQINRSDGTLSIDDDDIISYPPKGSKSIPIMNFIDEATGYVDLGFNESDSGRDENLKGQKINSTKKSAIINRFLIMLPLNPKLKSGNLIQFNVYVSEGDGTKLSRHYSGKYVIENSEHIWNHETHEGYTKIIIGRKYTGIIPDSYLLKSKLI